MTVELKSIPQESIPKALEKAKQYRWLNEPYQAESICQDILLSEPEHPEALILLLLSLTDQFGRDGFGAQERRARAVMKRLESDYERAYYEGLIYERRAKAQQEMGASADAVYESTRHAMELYERAEAMDSRERHDAILRWNTCARFMMDHRLEDHASDGAQFVAYGD